MLILCSKLISLCRPDVLLSILLTFKLVRRGLLTCLPATLLILTAFFFSVKLFLLKQTYKSFLFLSETMDIFCRDGSVQQAQQSTHLAEGLSPL